MTQCVRRFGVAREPSENDPHGKKRRNRRWQQDKQVTAAKLSDVNGREVSFSKVQRIEKDLILLVMNSVTGVLFGRTGLSV
jgi:hypothetical protein